MALVTLPYVFSVGTTIISAQHNSNFSTIYNDYNGNITNANIASAAAIGYTKLALYGTIKQSDLISNIIIPASQGGTNANLSSSAQGAVPYFSSTGTMSALAAGTSGQFLQSQGSSANPQWASISSLLGTWASKSFGIIYQASTDGFVTAYCTQVNSNTVGTGYTDSNSSPSTIRGYFSGSSGVTIGCSMMFPVKKNDYYEVTLANGAGSSAIYFLPIGS
jgi:hypothetical protein